MTRGVCAVPPVGASATRGSRMTAPASVALERPYSQAYDVCLTSRGLHSHCPCSFNTQTPLSLKCPARCRGNCHVWQPHGFGFGCRVQACKCVMIIALSFLAGHPVQRGGDRGAARRDGAGHGARAARAGRAGDRHPRLGRGLRAGAPAVRLAARAYNIEDAC